MSLQAASITNASLSMNITPPLVTPLTQINSVDVPLIYANVTKVSHVSGTYTPNNDAPIAIYFDANNQPTWLVLVCDRQLNVFLYSANGVVINQMPVTKLLKLTSLAPTQGNYTYLGFYGETASNFVTPMPQGVAVNYAIYWGNGTVS